MRVGLACVLVCVKVDGHHVHARAFPGAPGGGEEGASSGGLGLMRMELEQPHRDVVGWLHRPHVPRSRKWLIISDKPYRPMREGTEMGVSSTRYDV